MEKLKSWYIELPVPKPSLDDNSGDLDRLHRALKKETSIARVNSPLLLLKDLPSKLRASGFQIKCALFRDRLGYYLTGIKGKDEKGFLGVAVDLGTTRYVVSIMDLESKQELCSGNYLNPQAKVGPDILTRIHYAEDPKGREEIRELIVQDLDEKIKILCEKAGVDVEDIVNVAIAGNTAMTHLFLGIEPNWIIREPYIPPLNRLDLFSAEEVGLHLGKGTKVFLFPNIGSYFGGDLLAGLIECQMHKNEEIALFVDVGTNAEVVLGNSQWLVACAGAAGPALEGGVSKIGKQAAPGVIDKVKYDPVKKKFEYTTIENRPPIGICGSGMIDLAAELFVNGLLDIRGKFVRDREKSLFVEKDEILYLKLVDKSESGTGEDLLISQPEIDSLIRSKAAMYTILETLAETVGISLSQISKFYVGGTFGNFINPKSAITIGMLPDLPLDRFVPLGNTSLKGAKKLLIEPGCFDELFMLEEKITYIELNVNQEFMNKFSGAKFLPHTDLTKFPSVKLKNKI